LLCGVFVWKEPGISDLTKHMLLLLLPWTCVLADTPVLYTPDDGENWYREESNTGFNLNDVSVSMVNSTAIAVGDHGVILRRTDDGRWADVSLEGLTEDLFSVAVGVSSIMVCGARGTLLSSFDDGISWRVWSEFGHENTNLLSVNFDPTHTNSFFITGENGFVYSSTSGVVNTGDSTAFAGSCGKVCNGLPELVIGRNGTGYFVESREGFTVAETTLRGMTEMISGAGIYMVAGDGGSIYRLESDGMWKQVFSGTSEDLNDISYLSWGTTACAVGENGTVLISEDNGVSWRAENTGIKADLTAVSGNGAGVAFIVGRNILSELFENLPFSGIGN
jgi:photosystem II stability/assembly factor-like uncharacterized protein